MGVDTSADRVYPDLAFSLPAGPAVEPAPAAVGLGVMDYEGSNDDRARSEQIRSSYIRGMTDFSLWLIDQGRPVRFLAGDETDAGVIREVMARVRVVRPGIDPAAMTFEAANTLGDLMRQISSVDSVVASRFHTVLCALKLAKPTLAVGYAVEIRCPHGGNGRERVLRLGPSLRLCRAGADVHSARGNLRRAS